MTVKVEVDIREDPVTKHKIHYGIPVDFLYQYKKSTTAALRDLSAIVSSAVNPYFDQKNKVVNAIKDRPNPFLEQSMQFEDWFQPHKFPVYMHFDLAVTRCSAGVSACHSPGFVIRRTKDGHDVKVPYIVIDFLGRIEAPENEEIDLISLGDIPFRVQDLGFDLALVTYDRYESRQNIQRLKQYGIRSALLSIERTAHRVVLDSSNTKDGIRLEPTRGQYQAAWSVFKDAMVEERLSVPQHPHFYGDCMSCDWDAKKGKVVLSSLPGSKFDMIHAAVGSVFNCSNCEEPYWEYKEELVGLKELPEKNRVYSDLFNKGRLLESTKEEEPSDDLSLLGDLGSWNLRGILDD